MKLKNSKGLRSYLATFIIGFLVGFLIISLIVSLYESRGVNKSMAIEIENAIFDNLELEIENEILSFDNKLDNDTILEDRMLINDLDIQIIELKIELEKIMSELEHFQNMNRVIEIDSNDMTVYSNVSSVQLDTVLNGTNLEGLSDAYILAESTYNINAIHLLSLTILESDWARSRLAIDKNNISGFSAFDSNPYNDAKYFETKEDCIMATAKTLSENYIGDGLISLRQINGRYASDKQWHYKIATISRIIVEKLN